MNIRTYLQLFWVPCFASAVLIAIQSAQRGLSGMPMVLAWFLLALLAQYLGPPAGAWWIAGLVLQTALAIFLLFRLQLGRP